MYTSKIAFLTIHVDDILLIRSDTKILTERKTILSNTFLTKGMEKLR